MKESYKKFKKQIRTFLGLGTTCGLLGLYSLFSKMVIFGIILLLAGIVILGITFLLKKESLKMEEESKKNCLCCGKDVTHTFENRYFINDCPVKKDDFEKENTNKKRMEIHYYKCDECRFCYTVIHTYLCINGKEKQLNDKTNLDFDYTGDY